MTPTQSTEALATPLSPGDWHVDATRSELGFSTRMGGLFPVHGRYSGFDGELHIDSACNSSGTLRVPAETISTGIKMRDSHLRSKAFFHVDLHPHMTFELTGLTSNGDGAVTLTGALHICDRVLPINAPASVAVVDADGLRIDADFEVDHHAAGFEFKWLPRTVRIKAALTLAATS